MKEEGGELIKAWGVFITNEMKVITKFSDTRFVESTLRMEAKSGNHFE